MENIFPAPPPFLFLEMIWTCGYLHLGMLFPLISCKRYEVGISNLLADSELKWHFIHNVTVFLDAKPPSRAWKQASTSAIYPWIYHHHLNGDTFWNLNIFRINFFFISSLENLKLFPCHYTSILPDGNIHKIWFFFFFFFFSIFKLNVSTNIYIFAFCFMFYKTSGIL